MKIADFSGQNPQFQWREEGFAHLQGFLKTPPLLG